MIQPSNDRNYALTHQISTAPAIFSSAGFVGQQKRKWFTEHTYKCRKTCM